MEHFLNTQHCLTIAAAFIAIVAACASLINSANSKADGLATRYREVTKEFRDKRENLLRCEQLLAQIGLFEKRTKKVLWSQRLLFFTIGIFILSIAVFIGLALYLVFIPDAKVQAVAYLPLRFIGVCVSIGTLCMFAAISLQFLELGEAAQTFDIETRDCRPSETDDAPRAMVAGEA